MATSELVSLGSGDEEMGTTSGSTLVITTPSTTITLNFASQPSDSAADPINESPIDASLVESRSINIHGIAGHISRANISDYFIRFGHITHMECKWFGDGLGDCKITYELPLYKAKVLENTPTRDPDLNWGSQMSWHDASQANLCQACEVAQYEGAF